MVDEFSQRYGKLLTGSYDCVDRIVLNAYFSLGHNPGGFRTWWRRLHGSDEQLDDTHLMRMAGRLARRVKAWGSANGGPVIFCKAGERKHVIAEDYLATHEITGSGVFLLLAAKAPATVWKVKRSANGVITNLEKKTEYVNHYAFHVMDPDWGHVTIKMSGHPPFGAQIILERARVRGLPGTPGGDSLRQGRQLLHRCCRSGGPGPGRRCLVATSGCRAPGPGLRPVDLQRVSVLRPGPRRAASQRLRLRLLDLPGRVQPQPALSYRRPDATAVRPGVDRTRSRLDVPAVRTIFGAKARPHRDRSAASTIEAVIETPRYDLTWFKVAFGRLAVKAYTKGEHVLRFEATAHNTKDLKVGRALDKFPDIVARLATIAERFCTAVDCVDVGFLTDQTLDELPRPSTIGAVRVGGIDLNKPRASSLNVDRVIRTCLAAARRVPLPGSALIHRAFCARRARGLRKSGRRLLNARIMRESAWEPSPRGGRRADQDAVGKEQSSDEHDACRESSHQGRAGATRVRGGAAARAGAW